MNGVYRPTDKWGAHIVRIYVCVKLHCPLSPYDVPAQRETAVVKHVGAMLSERAGYRASAFYNREDFVTHSKKHLQYIHYRNI